MLAFTKTSQPPNICNEVKAVQQFGRQFTKFWKALFDVEALGSFEIFNTSKGINLRGANS